MALVLQPDVDVPYVFPRTAKFHSFPPTSSFFIEEKYREALTPLTAEGISDDGMPDMRLFATNRS